MRRLLVLAAVTACGGHSSPGAGGDAGGAPADTAAAPDAAPCTTHITYGQTWIHGANHPAQDDTATGDVTWDGSCTDDGASSYATLSNGWKPYFQGHSACQMGIDHAASCGAPEPCTTRITYADAWQHPANHPTQYDDVTARVFWDGTCTNSGSGSYATLSNGFAPHFTGANACGMAFRWQGCGGLYANPVLPGGCPDPGVVQDGASYVMTCTSGGAADAFPMYVSTDLVHWTAMGHILPAAAKPAWATGDFWAPEIHRVGAHWVAYFAARQQNGVLAIGAASAPSSIGPYTALAQPLLAEPSMGLIDPSELTAPSGTPYLLWKEDGNAQGKPTPIHAQQLAADGLSLTGPVATLITNDQAWEGAVTEAPWMVEHGGSFYLFYSGNSYANASYAIGVARASSPLGPFTKAPGPIVTTGGAWVGPGHCAVVDRDGASYVVYHAWQQGHVNGPGDMRYPLVDQLQWGTDWPAVSGAPSSASRPVP